MVFTVALLLIVGALSAIYLWFQRNHSYWQRKGIPYVQPSPIVGNTGPVLTQKNSFGLHIAEIYSDPKMQDEAAVGIYVMNKPALVIREPELIKSVLIKDFNRFSNRYGRSDPHGDALGSNNLFFVRNPEWKEIRTKLTPVFTSGKLKQMYPLMQEIADDLEELLARETGKDASNVMDIKDTCARFTTDLIATTAFGVRANSLANPGAEFRTQGRKVFEPTLIRAKDILVAFFLPKLVSVFRTKLFSKDFSNFMRTTVNHVIAERERSGTIRNDLIDVFVGLRKEAAQNPDKPHMATKKDFLVGQAGVFFTAGYETSSSAMTFGLLELARQPELQDRLRKEIHEAFMEEGTGKLSYEKIHSLEYLSMVVDEVLRLYPTLPFLDREYQSIKGQPDLSLKPYYDFKLENGTPVYIPVYGLQRDPKYWSNPNQFDPERFSPENRKKIEPMAYQPFGLGPHNCIGSRIGLIQSKLGLVHILKNYYVRSCPQTIKELEFNPNFAVLQLKSGVFLELVHDRLYDDAHATANVF